MAGGIERVDIGNLATNPAFDVGTTNLSVTAGSSESNVLIGGVTNSDGYVFTSGGTNNGTTFGSESVQAGVAVTLTIDDQAVAYTTTSQQSALQVAGELNSRLRRIYGKCYFR